MSGFPRWLLRKPAEDSAARIFCFPYSGVGASMFNQWPRSLAGVEICPIQLPARENRIREPHFGTYEQLAADLVTPLQPYLNRPFVFFGHCAGALPAFETARLLADSGLPTPQRLVVSAQAPPHHCPHDRFLDLTDEQLSAELAAMVVARGGQPLPLLIELTLSVLRLDLAATRLYSAERSLLPGGVTVLNWSADPEVDLGLLRDWTGYSHDVQFRQLTGGHYEFLSAPPELLELLTGQALRLEV
ncbi:MAG: thioesterase domain-containing protein [Jatrophihabitantaceae bacterium]